MSNIEEMEKIFDRFNRNMFCDAVADNIAIRDFMRMSLDSLKDLHEENTRLWKELAELKGKQDFKCTGLDDKGNYVYEPNE